MTTQFQQAQAPPDFASRQVTAALIGNTLEFHDFISHAFSRCRSRVTLVLTGFASLSAKVSTVCLAEAIPELVRIAGDALRPGYYMIAATAKGIVVMAMMKETPPAKQ